MTSTVLWLGSPLDWADALPGFVQIVDVPDAVVGTDAALVVLAEGVGPLGDWLRQPRTRPPVLVVCGTDAEEDAALRAGAEGVLSPGASSAEANRAARRAIARHAHVQTDAELYRMMIESVTDLVTVVDASGRTIYASPSAEAQTGRTAEDLRAQAPFAGIHPDDREAAVAAFQVGMASGQPATLRYRNVGPDGRVRLLESHGRAAVGPDGRPYGIVTTRDVTEVAETERRLTASETRFRTIVHALPDVVSRLQDDGLVLDFHVPEVFATEFPAASMIGRSLPDIIPPDLAEKYRDAMDRLRQSGEAVWYDYEVAVDGRTRYREVRMAPFGDGEVLSMLRDVTPLREHEAALERSRAELQALATHLQNVREEERTRLSREVHDVLGQQLTAIRLGIGWFGRHFPDHEAAQARLDDVRQTIDETIRHVRQIAADLRPGVLDDFGLASAVEWQAGRFEERTGVGCRIVVEGADEPPREVATAAFRVLQEALTNVARHAEAQSVTITLGLGPREARLVVADDGRGFDPTTMRQRSLGLVGMRERAAALGGALAVRGEPGRGTVVECTLPVDTTPETP